MRSFGFGYYFGRSAERVFFVLSDVQQGLDGCTTELSTKTDMSERLTERLLAQEPDLLQQATSHAFLRNAGAGELQQAQLEAWLTQDRLYITCGYVQLMGALLQKLSPTEQGPSHSSSTGFSTKLHILTAALTNIERELRFFEDTAAENGLRLDVAPSSALAGADHPQTSVSSTSLLHPATRQYIDHIRKVSQPASSFNDALVLLWAMEIIYLQAWRFAASHRLTARRHSPSRVCKEHWMCSSTTGPVPSSSSLSINSALSLTRSVPATQAPTAFGRKPCTWRSHSGKRHEYSFPRRHDRHTCTEKCTDIREQRGNSKNKTDNKMRCKKDVKCEMQRKAGTRAESRS